MNYLISLFKTEAFKRKPFQTLINSLYLIVSLIFSLNPKIKIRVGHIEIIYKIFNLRTKNFGGRGLLICRELIEDLFIVGPKIIDNKKNVIIDAGANFGMYSILFAKLNLNNRVYSIEPFRDYNRIIKYNSKLNKIKNIKIINKVLSDKISEYKLNINLGNTSASITRNINTPNYLKIKSTTIDSIVKFYNIRQVDFIKLDIEGAELLALNGGRTTIKKFKPKIVLECSSKKEFIEVKNFFLKFNYKPYIFDKNLNRFIVQRKYVKFYTNLFFFNKKHLKSINLND